MGKSSWKLYFIPLQGQISLVLISFPPGSSKHFIISSSISKRAGLAVPGEGVLGQVGERSGLMQQAPNPQSWSPWGKAPRAASSWRIRAEKGGHLFFPCMCLLGLL